MLSEPPVSQLAREYEDLARLFAAQPALTRHFLDRQAAALAAALEQGGSLIRFQLPDRIILEGGEALELPPLPHAQALSQPGHPARRAVHSSPAAWNDLEAKPQPGPGRVRQAAPLHPGAPHRSTSCSRMGARVHYQPESGDDIPSIPVGEGSSLRPCWPPSDAVVEARKPTPDTERPAGPYVDAARRFYLPQWVAFGEDDRLLVGSLRGGRGLRRLAAATPSASCRRRSPSAPAWWPTRPTSASAPACSGSWSTRDAPWRAPTPARSSPGSAAGPRPGP